MRAPQQRPPSKLEPFKDYLVTRLAEFPELSVEALFEEIRSLGYEGGRTILKEFTLPYRIRRKEPVVRFETPPGQQAQVDWAHLGTHVLAGRPTPLYLFVMILSFSRALHAEVTTSMDLSTFLECHLHAFQSFGGMPREILYDNARTVVIRRSSSGPVFHPGLLDLAGRYGFAPRVCRPYRAKTKGKVERSIRYLKDRFFCGRTFTDIPDLNHQLEAWIQAVANQREHKTTGEKPAERLLREGLLPLERVKPRPITPPLRRADRPLFCFAPVAVQVRSLSAYEEVTV